MPSGKWQAVFYRDTVNHYIGCFNTKEEAINARAKALAEYENKTKSA